MNTVEVHLLVFHFLRLAHYHHHLHHRQDPNLLSLQTMVVEVDRQVAHQVWSIQMLEAYCV